MLEELVHLNRSYRRYHEAEDVPVETLRGLVNLARLSPSRGNLQPLRYILCSGADRTAKVFPHLRWAAYLPDWHGPAEGERPPAYIVIVGDTEVTRFFGCEHGIAAQSILLGAVEAGLGGCLFADVEWSGLRRDLGLDERYELLLVVAVGKPRETVLIDRMRSHRDFRYWRDATGNHHVPKRPLDELILPWGSPPGSPPDLPDST